MFSLFVIPFCLGVVLLAGISAWKYIRWIRHFDKRQQVVIRRNIWSWRFLPAIWEAFREGLLHWRITKHHFLLGYMHRSLAFGWFLLIVVGAVQAALAFPNGHPFYAAIFFNFFEPRSEHLVHFAQSQIYANLMDVLLIYVLSGLFLATLKKVWSRPLGMHKTTRHNLIDRVAKFSLWSIFPLRLLAEGATSALYQNGGFLVVSVGSLMKTIGLDNELFEYNLWVFYSLALGTFFTLMPFSRYMHIFTEIFLIFFRQLGLRETPYKDGYTLFELSACSRCGICIDGCPMHDPLNINTTQGVYMLQNIRNKDLWNQAMSIADNCLVCGRCSSDCPVQIDLETIRRQVRTKSKETIDNKKGYTYLKSVHPFNAVGRIGFFGGCMSHLTPGITEAMEHIFQAAKQDYWYIDKERTICCGRPLLQQGFVHQAEELRRRNSDLIAQSGITMLVTSCPICYQSFSKEYHLSIPVLHHSEYIAQLIQEGHLSVESDSQRITYHDPCELGRGCSIYDAPREVLRNVGQLLKTQHEREKSLCCGINLGNTVINNEQQALVRNRAYENLVAPQPDVVATACPMCKKALSRNSETPVRDIAELVKEHLSTPKVEGQMSRK